MNPATGVLTREAGLGVMGATSWGPLGAVRRWTTHHGQQASEGARTCRDLDAGLLPPEQGENQRLLSYLLWSQEAKAGGVCMGSPGVSPCQGDRTPPAASSGQDPVGVPGALPLRHLPSETTDHQGRDGTCRPEVGGASFCRNAGVWRRLGLPSLLTPPSRLPSTKLGSRGGWAAKEGSEQAAETPVCEAKAGKDTIARDTRRPRREATADMTRPQHAWHRDGSPRLGLGPGHTFPMQPHQLSGHKSKETDTRTLCSGIYKPRHQPPAPMKMPTFCAPILKCQPREPTAEGCPRQHMGRGPSWPPRACPPGSANPHRSSLRTCQHSRNNTDASRGGRGLCLGLPRPPLTPHAQAETPRGPAKPRGCLREDSRPKEAERSQGEWREAGRQRPMAPSRAPKEGGGQRHPGHR